MNNRDEHGLANYLPGVGDNFELARQRQEPNPSRTYFWRTKEGDGYDSKRVKVSVGLGQHSRILYAGPTLRPTYKGNPFSLGQKNKKGPYRYTFFITNLFNLYL